MRWQTRAIGPCNYDKVDTAEAEAALAEAQEQLAAEVGKAQVFMDHADALVLDLRTRLVAAEGLAGIDGDEIPSLIAAYKARIAELEGELQAFKCNAQKEYNALEAENARLKAERERFRKEAAFAYDGWQEDEIIDLLEELKEPARPDAAPFGPDSLGRYGKRRRS